MQYIGEVKSKMGKYCSRTKKEKQEVVMRCTLGCKQYFQRTIYCKTVLPLYINLYRQYMTKGWRTCCYQSICELPLLSFAICLINVRTCILNKNQYHRRPIRCTLYYFAVILHNKLSKPMNHEGVSRREFRGDEWLWLHGHLLGYGGVYVNQGEEFLS